MSTNEKSEQHRKPVGTAGLVVVGKSADGSPTGEFISIDYGQSKEEIENFFIVAAMKNGLSNELQIRDQPKRNKENDFDFTIDTVRGEEYIDLMEVALLDRSVGSYDTAPNGYNIGEFSLKLWRGIIKKSQKYGTRPRSNLHLLLYRTDWRFPAVKDVQDLIAYWAHWKPHCFAGIFYYEPYDKQQGQFVRIHPRSDKDFEGFDEEVHFRTMVSFANPTRPEPRPDGSIAIPLGRLSKALGRTILDPVVRPKKQAQRRSKNQGLGDWNSQKQEPRKRRLHPGKGFRGAVPQKTPAMAVRTDPQPPTSGAIPKSVLEGMKIEVNWRVAKDDEPNLRFHAALENYYQHYDDDTSQPYRTEVACCYIETIPVYVHKPPKVLSGVHWRAIHRCANGEPYKEEERKESPFQLLDLHTKQVLRICVTNGTSNWKIFKIWVSHGDGSLHCVNHVEQLINTKGKFHYTYHASGAVHDTNQQGKKRLAALYWPNFGEMESAPVNGVGLDPRQFHESNHSVAKLLRPSAPNDSVIFTLPTHTKMFYFEMWIGKSEHVNSITALKDQKRLLIESDKVPDFHFFRLATFRDPKDGHEFEMGFAIALVVREEDRL